MIALENSCGKAYAEAQNMKYHSARFCFTTLILTAALGLGSRIQAATTNSWTNTVSDLWRTGTNWSSNQPPNSTFMFILITNANTKTITIDAATPATNLTIQRLA